jgi:hypothetical protein
VEEETAWREKQKAAGAAAPAEFHFVCESFFMALKVGCWEEGAGAGFGVGLTQRRRSGRGCMLRGPEQGRAMAEARPPPRPAPRARRRRCTWAW